VSDRYVLPRSRTAEVRGKRTRFRSYYKWGTFGLHMDAVQALKDAGIYERPIDSERLRIDGHPHIWM